MKKRKNPYRPWRKLVWTSDPYQQNGYSTTDLVGRVEEMKLVTAAWMASPARFLWLAPRGEPGVGKNRLVYELARRSNAISTSSRGTRMSRPRTSLRRAFQRRRRQEHGLRAVSPCDGDAGGRDLFH